MGFIVRPMAILPQLGAAGAMLICFAIVLNVGGFDKPAKRELAEANTKQTAPPIWISPPKAAEDTRQERDESIVEAAGDSAPIRPLIELSSTTDPAGTPTPAAQPDMTIVGVWVPDAGACSVRNFREGLLPTIINMDGAWAGETFCIFKNQKQTETGWKLRTAPIRANSGRRRFD
jgi:hypothetical protein